MRGLLGSCAFACIELHRFNLCVEWDVQPFSNGESGPEEALADLVVSWRDDMTPSSFLPDVLRIRSRVR